MQTQQLISVLKKHQSEFHKVVSFNTVKDKLLSFDFTESNIDLTAELIEDTEGFSNYISRKLQIVNCKLGIGGYAEPRTVYSRSKVFDAAKPDEEPRRLHLGTDIWGKAEIGRASCRERV